MYIKYLFFFKIMHSYLHWIISHIKDKYVKGLATHNMILSQIKAVKMKT